MPRATSASGVKRRGGSGRGDGAASADAPSSAASASAASAVAGGGGEREAPLSPPRRERGAASASHASDAALSGHEHQAVGAAAATLAAAAAAPPEARRWHDWTVRWVTSLAMIACALLLIHFTRQIGVTIFVLVIQSLIYGELVTLAAKASVEAQMPFFKYLYVFWFAVLSFNTYASVLKPHILAALGLAASGDASAAVVESAASATGLPQPAIAALLFALRNIAPITFSLYMAGIMAFVFLLNKRRNFRYQFHQFAFCHLAMFVIMPSTHLVANAYKGLYWFLLPISLVVVNDSFAYVFGFLLGRTPLIPRLSPKKTVEGFVGGALMTLLAAVAGTALLSRVEAYGVKWLMLCPANADFGTTVNRCDTDAVSGGIFRFAPLLEFVPGTLGRYLPDALLHLELCEMQLHAVALAVFASLVAPFGGFFASGFKRAFHFKDFGSAIPGHGGFTDRMDCQVVMALFSALYLQYGIGDPRGGLEDVARTFGKAAERFSLPDFDLLQRLAACLVARAIAANASWPSGAHGGGVSAAEREEIIDAASRCRAELAASHAA